MGVDYLDYTALQKRGLLKKEYFEDEKESELMDLTKREVSNISNSISSSEQQANPLSMFDNISSLSSVTPTTSFFDNPISSAPSLPSTSLSSASSEDMSALKIKLDDFEYKFSKLMERLERIEMKLDSERNTRV